MNSSRSCSDDRVLSGSGDGDEPIARAGLSSTAAFFIPHVLTTYKGGASQGESNRDPKQTHLRAYNHVVEHFSIVASTCADTTGLL